MHPTYNGPFRVVPVVLVTVANEANYSFPDKKQFQEPYKVIGFSHRAYHADRRTEDGKTLVSDAVIKASHLRIKHGHSDEVMSIPLETVVQDLTGFKDAYWISPMYMDFSNSKINLQNTGAISAGAAYELLVYVADESIAC